MDHNFLFTLSREYLRLNFQFHGFLKFLIYILTNFNAISLASMPTEFISFTKPPERYSEYLHNNQ